MLRHMLALALSFCLLACGDDDGMTGSDGGFDGGADAGFDGGFDGGSDTMPLAANGADCTAPAECESGFCVDDVCCAGACDGVCERCDESDDGSCTPAAVDTDPDDECGAVMCDAYHMAVDDVCLVPEDATDSACDGAGACVDADTVCAGQPDTEQISCVSCGSLVADTCVDDTPGECGFVTRVLDTFDGPTLDPAWTDDHLGPAPTYTVDGTLQITDSSPATTPSSSCSWIYDLDTDKGNQIGRDVAVGTGDFVLEIDMSASSTLGQLTLGGVALTNADDGLEIFAAFWDGGETTLGQFQGGVAPDALSEGWAGTAAESVTASVLITRVGDTVTTSLDGVVVETTTSAADIEHLVIVHTQHLCGIPFEFGTFEVDRISLCY